MKIRIISVPNARNAAHWHEEGGEVGTNNNRPQDQPQISWIESWLNSRKDVMAKNIAATRFSNQVPVYSPINNTGDVRDAGFNADYNYPSYNPLYWFLGQDPRIKQAEKIINREVQNIKNVPVTNVGNEYQPSYGQLGIYVEPSYLDNSGNYVAFLGTPKDEVKIHEFTHASNPKPQEYYIEDVLYKDEDIPKSVPGKNKHAQSKELYAALQEVRYKSGLKPNVVVDEQWLENNKKYFKNTYLEGLPNNILIRLFNELAQNSSSFKKSDNSYLAALGGELKSTGGPLYPFSFQKNPYWKTPVVRYADGGSVNRESEFLPNENIQNVEVWLNKGTRFQKRRPGTVNLQNIVEALNPNGPNNQYVWDNAEHTSYSAFRRNPDYRAPLVQSISSNIQPIQTTQAAIPQINVSVPKSSFTKVVSKDKWLPVDSMWNPAYGYETFHLEGANPALYGIKYYSIPGAVNAGQGSSAVLDSTVMGIPIQELNNRIFDYRTNNGGWSSFSSTEN